MNHNKLSRNPTSINLYRNPWENPPKEMTVEIKFQMLGVLETCQDFMAPPGAPDKTMAGGRLTRSHPSDKPNRKCGGTAVRDEGLLLIPDGWLSFLQDGFNKAFI